MKKYILLLSIKLIIFGVIHSVLLYTLNLCSSYRISKNLPLTSPIIVKLSLLVNRYALLCQNTDNKIEQMFLML